MDHPASSLVVTKTSLPPRRTGLLRRPRLVDFIYAHIEKQLLLITAPAGYGKTSLLLDFAHDAEFPVAWYALDEFDNAPLTFLEYLIESIRVHFPDFGHQARAAMQSASDSLDSLRSIVSMIANEMFRLPDHLVIVLDDYHAIHSEVIDDLIALLIRYAGESCHLIIDSRTLPRIPDQVLLLARGQMDGLSINELKFTAPEIQALIQQNYDLTVSERRSQELAKVTDGWITALLLMGYQSGWRQLVEGAVSTPEAAGRVYDYLAEQIFSKQSDEVRHFLLGSSILDTLSLKTLDRLPGLEGSGSYLRTLLEQQLFLTRLGGAEETFVYHPLFRDFLRARLQAENSKWYKTLAVACAEMYAEQNQWERVVEIYLSLGEVEKAAAALESAEQLMRLPSHLAAMRPWIEALPVTLTQFRPRLLSLRGRMYRSRGELEQAVKYFDRAAALCQESGDVVSAADNLELKGTTLRFLGRYRECITESQAIDALLAGQDRPEAARLRALSLHLRGLAEYYLGDLSNAFAHLQQARELFLSTDDMISIASIHHDLGITAHAMGRLLQALEYYSAALSYWGRLQDPVGTANTLNSLGNVYLLQGQTQDAERILREALTQSRTAGALRVQTLVLATLGDVYRDYGDYPQALEFYADSLRIAQECHDASMTLYSKVLTGDTYRLMGNFGRAHEWLDSASEGIRSSGSSNELGQLKQSRGLLASDQGKLDAAIPQIEDAIQLFRQGGNRHFEALAEFNLAHVFNLQGRVKEAESHLIRTAELVGILGYDQFLVVEGRRAELTLILASSLSIVGTLFKRILERVRPLPSAMLAHTLTTGVVPMLAVYTLGQERFTISGQEVMELRPQVRELFLFLLTRYPQGARRDELWELFWRDLSPERADGVLRISMSRIRKALCPITLSNGWYSVAAEQLWYDVQEFERGLADARRAQSSRGQIVRLQQALDLYGGDYLQRVDGEWVAAERERLRRACLAALITLAQAHAEQGDIASALRTYEKATLMEPYFELAWKGAIESHLKLGNRASALANYEKLKHILHAEMGIEPSPEIQTLYRRIIQMSI